MEALTIATAVSDTGTIPDKTTGVGTVRSRTGLQIDVDGDAVVLSGSLFCLAAAEYLVSEPREEWERLFGRALEIGVFCLERASSSQDMEFVRRQADRVMKDVASVIGTIPESVSAELVRLVGSQDGQVLAPIVQLVNSAASVAEKGVSEARKLLHDIDPARSDGSVGRALKSVRDLLDPQRRDSVQSQIEEVLRTFGDRGGQFAGVLKAVVEDVRIPAKLNADSEDAERGFRASRTRLGAERRVVAVS